MNKSELLELLNRLGLRPSRRLGQNFLLDPNMLDSLVRCANVQPGESILEIGPGTGVLTERLLAAGCKLTAVELDHRLAAYLRDERFAGVEGFRLVEADACRVDFDELFGDEPFRCIANLPYSSSSQLLASLSGMRNRPREIYVLLQKEMADRLTAEAGTKDYGVLTVRLGLMYSISILKRIPKNVFFPSPEVVSAYVRMSLRDAVPDLELMGRVSRIAGIAFAQRRKKTSRMLEGEYGLDRVLSVFSSLGLPEDVRADGITPAQYVGLGRALV